MTEFEKYAVITFYLWLLFALFSLHKQLVQGHGISVWHQGFDILNALIFGKIILIGQALKVGKDLERRALIWDVLGKSLIFAILLIAFHSVEEVIRVARRANHYRPPSLTSVARCRAFSLRRPFSLSC